MKIKKVLLFMLVSMIAFSIVGCRKKDYFFYESDYTRKIRKGRICI